MRSGFFIALATLSLVGAAGVQAHGKDPNTQKMAATIKDLLDGPPSADRLILVSSKP